LPSTHLFQACETLAEPQTRKREIAALSEAMAELGIAEATIVTRSEEERITMDKGSINVTPAWRFLLELPGMPE
jgi:predicted AAA+ superfamily ATPase